MNEASINADDDARPLSLVEAARLVDPRDSEVARHVVLLRAELAAGRLEGQRRGSDAHHWTTTRRALAEYLARQQVNRRREVADPRSRAAHGRPSEPRRHAEDAVRDAWREYFLAVLGARAPRRASGSFRAAVVAGQLVLIAAAVVLSWRAAVAVLPGQLTPEQQAVVRWLEANAPRYRVEQWLPEAAEDSDSADESAAPAGARLRVRYSYHGPGGRRINTLRQFTLREGEVIRVDSP